MRASVALLVLLCTVPVPASAQVRTAAQARAAEGGGVPLDRQALVMLRVLAFDRNLTKRVSGSLTVAVVRGSGPGSAEAQGVMVRALERIAGSSTVLGLQVKIVGVAYEGPGDFEARLKESGATALYLCPGVGRQGVQVAADLARRHRMLSFSGDDADLQLGTAFALVRRGARVAIVINRPVVGEAGADLAPELVAMAEMRG